MKTENIVYELRKRQEMNTLKVLGSTSFRRHKVFYKMQCCSFRDQPVKFMEMQRYWKRVDKVPENWELIYKAPMDNAFKWISTYVTVSTGAFMCLGIYYGVTYHTAERNKTVYLGDSDIVLADSIMECLTYFGAFIVFHLAVKILISKYVLRLYKNTDKYIAIFRGHYFNHIKKHEFHLNGFKKLNPTFVVPWGDARFSLGGKHGIILEPYFKTPHDFNYLITKKKLETTDE